MAGLRAVASVQRRALPEGLSAADLGRPLSDYARAPALGNEQAAGKPPMRMTRACMHFNGAHRPDMPPVVFNLKERVMDIKALHQEPLDIEHASAFQAEAVEHGSLVALQVQEYDGSPELLQAVLQRLSAALDDLANSSEAFAELVRRVRDAASTDSIRPEMAMFLGKTSLMLRNMGQRKPALTLAQIAADIVRLLAIRDPRVFLPHLPTLLSALALRFADTGQHQRALEVAQESFRIARTLACGAEAHLAKLAEATLTLGWAFAGLGKQELALLAAEGATRLYRRLDAQKDGQMNGHKDEQSAGEHRQGLAVALRARACHLNALGQHTGAAAAAQEAVDILRDLRNRAGSFEAELARCYITLADAQGACGHRDPALAAARAAVTLLRKLEPSAPEEHRPDLAAALDTLAARLGDIGLIAEGLRAAQEGHDRFRMLADQEPWAFRASEAKSSTTLAARLCACGKRDSAMRATRQACDLYRTLAAESPDAFEPHLAAALIDLAQRLSAVGEHGAAEQAAQEAIDRYTQLAERRPVFEAALAQALAVRQMI